MEGPTATLPPTDEVRAAFPSSCASVISAVVPKLSWRAGPSTGRFYEVSLGADRLRIPERISFDAGTLDEAAETLPLAQRSLIEWFFTRHPDGHVRERCLRRVIETPAPWAPAFVLRLLGEYVIEIVDLIQAHVPAIDPAGYRAFLLENPRFYETTRSRVESYWDCYYRDWPRAVYPGFAVLEALDALLAGPH